MAKGNGYIFTKEIGGIDVRLRYSIQAVAERGNIKVVMFNWKVKNDKGELERKQVKRSILKSERLESPFKLKPLAEEVIEDYIKDQLKTHIVNADNSQKISIIWANFLEQRTGISEATKRPIHYFFKRFFEFIPTDRIADLTPDIVKKAVTKIESLCEKKEMEWKYWANIHAYVFGKGSTKNPQGGLFHWLIHTKQILKGNEWEKLHVSAPDKAKFNKFHDGVKRNPQYYWEDEEIIKIHEELSIVWKDYFWIMAHTGMDLSDLADLKDDHIVPWEKNPGKYMIDKLRKKEERFNVRIKLPLSGKVERIILNARNMPKDSKLNPERLLFPDLKNKLKNSHSQMYNRVRAAWQIVYPKKPHKNVKALRHTYITKHLDKGTPMHILQDYVGHSDKSTIIRERYKGTVDSVNYIDNV